MHEDKMAGIVLLAYEVLSCRIIFETLERRPPSFGAGTLVAMDSMNRLSLEIRNSRIGGGAPSEGLPSAGVLMQLM